jgi:hypothetical protein
MAKRISGVAAEISGVSAVDDVSMAGAAEGPQRSAGSPQGHNLPGYKVYRGTASGGPRTIVNFGLIFGVTHQNTAAQPGQTFNYLVTAVTC